jgi:hypothetical protein
MTHDQRRRPARAMMFERLEFTAADPARCNSQPNFVRSQREWFNVTIFQLVKRGVAERTHGILIGVPFLALRCKGEGDEKTWWFS